MSDPADHPAGEADLCRWQAGDMDTRKIPPSGKITIQWKRGHEAGDPDTYAWEIKCEPQIPDEIAAAILAEILKVY